MCVQPNGYAVCHPPATTAALVGRRLADGLNQQLLYFLAVAVALDPRCAGVNDVANTWHCQRGFCHVGGQHNTPATTRFKHPVLLGLAQAGKQGQYVRVAQHGLVTQVLAQVVGSLSDLSLTR